MVLEARLDGHEAGYLEYARRDELVGSPIYLANITVEAPYRHAGVARALVTALVRRAGQPPIYVAALSQLDGGQHLLEAWNRYCALKIHWHAD